VERLVVKIPLSFRRSNASTRLLRHLALSSSQDPKPISKQTVPQKT
jgi:hypothetical protein